MRTALGVADLDAAAARTRVRERLPDASPEDLLLLGDLVGIADPAAPLAEIAADARRRRLTALVNAATLSRGGPALYIIEDVHWIDPASESMLAEFLTVIRNTSSAVLITARTGYEGALTQLVGVQTIPLAPLHDSDAADLLGELMGPDPSVASLKGIIIERAAGNPFFAEEMVRELELRGVLTGQRGRHHSDANVADVSVPVTVQATIQARIDRLSASAKHILNAASVIGACFSADLLDVIGVDPVFDELLGADLLDQVQFAPAAVYAFRHPLIRAVAYESQLKSARAQTHRCVAAAIQQRAPESEEQNAALIAGHLEAAGELHTAYGWYMRAGAWSASRDVDAARLNWLQAQRIADLLPAGEAGSLPMRIAPRTMLCVTDWQARPVQQCWGRFAELRELCNAAGDKRSLAIGMTGLASELLYSGRPGEGSRLASEQMELLESVEDPGLTVGLAFVPFANWFNSGDFDEILRCSQTVVDLAAGDPTMGAGFGVGSPLAIALAFRGIARFWLGIDGWRRDLADAVEMAQKCDPSTLALVSSWNLTSMFYGASGFDDAAMHVLEDAMRLALGSSNDFAVTGSHFGLGAALLYRDDPADRERGLEMMVDARERWLPERAPSLVPLAELMMGRELVRRGNAAVPTMVRALRELQEAGRLGWSVLGTSILVETVLEHGDRAAFGLAEEGAEWMAGLHSARPTPMVDVTLLRLRALLARARGERVEFRQAAGRYRDKAESLGFDGHIAWAKAMV